jgi:competence protein ComEC
MAAGALGLTALWPVAAAALAGRVLALALTNRVVAAASLALLAAAGLLAAARYQASLPTVAATDLAAVQRQTSLRGTVIADAEERDLSQRLEVRIEEEHTEGSWHPATGRVLVTTRPFPRFAYGDRLELSGELALAPRFEGFDYREYLARRDVGWVMSYPAVRRLGTGGGSDGMRALAAVRNQLGELLQRSMPAEEASLARAILLGQRTAMPRDLTQDFNDAGISHLVAISGYNVMLVAGFVLASLSWLTGRRAATLIAMLLVLMFAVFVGATPPVMRAALMAQVVLSAELFGRPGSAAGALAIAAAVLTAENPQIVHFASFQLSVAAALGLAVLAGPLQERLRLLLPGFGAIIAEPAAVTIAASLAAQPLIALHFQRVSLVALPANLVALPAFPLVLLGSAVTALFGGVSQDAGRFSGSVAYLPVAYIILAGRTFASLPLAVVSLEGAAAAGALLFAFLLAALGLAVRIRTGSTESPNERLSESFWASLFIHRYETPARRPPLRLRPLLGVALVLALLGGGVWYDALVPDERDLAVTFLDVGQGDAILIETPSGRRVLVDGGPSPDVLQRELARQLPARARRIDLVVLTHAQTDHVAGLVGLGQRYAVGAYLVGNSQGLSAAYVAWAQDAIREGSAISPTGAGRRLDLGDGIRLEVLAPASPRLEGTRDDVNNNSVVLRLVHGRVSFLLTGDLAAAGEQALLDSGQDLRSTVLKLGHHGSDGSSSAEFLRSVSPHLAVVSVGHGNPYGHPSPTTRLRLRGLPLLRTDEHGSVKFVTDGVSLTLKTQRGPSPLSGLEQTAAR